MIEEINTILAPRPMQNFVETPYIKEISERALYYIKAGFPIHFRGISGTGKTTLAMHIANKIGRPVIMVHGDEEFSTSDLVGGEYGYRAKKVIDNFIHSVLKTEENVAQTWVDNRLTIACKYGFSLIYDEFTRSRPEANNVLLSVLQEKIISLPAGRIAQDNNSENYLKVHPDFTAIFTSNPEEYAGVHRTQDALRDRMITLDLDYFDRETEIRITIAKSGLSKGECERIVDIVRNLRSWGEYEFSPTIRGCIMIARTLKTIKEESNKDNNKMFLTICQDILASETSRLGKKVNQEKVKAYIKKLVEGG
ncbi:MAG: gas vesicle protein GvpN [Armatimonadetes bacterium]|nr:gas vesicle protein GvpN [Armatimonadota bacterium]